MEYFNPHSGEWLLNKFNIYKDLRTRDSAYWSEEYQMYVITRYNDVMFALNNPDIFSSAHGNLIVEDPIRFGMTLGASDNPTHDVYKNIVKNAYSKDNIQRIEGFFIEKARELLSNKTIINISEVIEELSAWTISEVINLPMDKKIIKDLVFDIQRNSRMAVQRSKDSASSKAFKNLVEMTTGVIKLPAKGPGIYKEYMENNPNNIKIISLFVGPTISGASSLTGALEFLTLDLYRENQLDLLIENRELIPNAINESLRLHASTGRFSRTVEQEVELHNVKLKPGDRVALCLESANRDPDAFEDPDRFLLTRNTSKSLAFGHGLHACIALAISKKVMTTYLELLLDIVGKYKVLTLPENFKYVITASGNDDMISNLVIEKC